jgi:hypothetical protein
MAAISMLFLVQCFEIWSESQVIKKQDGLQPFDIQT